MQTHKLQNHLSIFNIHKTFCHLNIIYHILILFHHFILIKIIIIIKHFIESLNNRLNILYRGPLS